MPSLTSRLPPIRGLNLTQLRLLFKFAGRRLNEERLPQVAGSLTFTSVLALVPILTIALAIFTTFPLFKEFRLALEQYFLQSLIPQPIASTILSNLNLFASKASRLSAVGAAVLLLTAITTLILVENTFNRIWRVKTGRGMAQRILVYWSLITLGPLLIGGSISLTSQLSVFTDDAIRQVGVAAKVVYTALSILLTTGAFTLLYVMVPNRVVFWRDAVWGGLVAALGFELIKELFVNFVAQFSTYTMVYGALAALPIFLLWVYACWLITLFGAVLAAALPVVKYERWWHVAAPGTDFLDAVAVLAVLHEARETTDAAAVDANDIRNLTRIGFDESERLLQAMLEAGWVARLRPDREKRSRRLRGSEALDRWVLLSNPQQLRLTDVYRLFVFQDTGDNPLGKQVEGALQQALGQSLADYCNAPARKKVVQSAFANTSASQP